MLTVEDLKYAVGHGGAFSNKYEIDLQIPTILKMYYNVASSWGIGGEGSYSQKINNFKTLAHKVTVAGSEMSTPSVWVRGQEMKLRGKINFGQRLKVTCYLDESHFFKRTMDTWMRAIDMFNGPIVGTMLPSALGGSTGMVMNLISKFTGQEIHMGYMSNIEINQLVGGKRTVKYKFYHTFPVSVSDIEFNGAESSQLQSVTVDFAYAYMNCENFI